MSYSGVFEFADCEFNIRFVVIGENKKRSSWLHTNVGVPQGLVLGPLLFLLFINNISSAIQFSNYLIYADDLQIYINFYINDFKETIRLFKSDVLGILRWSNANSLNLNLAKTKLIILGSAYFVKIIYN